MLKLFKSIALFMMPSFSGGGGGGDDTQEKMLHNQNIQEGEMAEAVRKINSLFGKSAPDLYAEQVWETPGGQGKVRLPQDDYLRKMAAYNERMINRDRQSSRNDIYGFLTDKLKRTRKYDRELINRSNRSRGMSDSSDALEAARRMLERYNDTLVDVGNRSDQAVNQMRKADEQSRLNLISMIRSGMDSASAVESAKAALDNNINNVYGNAVSQDLGDVFGDIRNLYTQYKFQQGRDSFRPPPGGSKTGSYYNAPGTAGNIT